MRAILRELVATGDAAALGSDIRCVQTSSRRGARRGEIIERLAGIPRST